MTLACSTRRCPCCSSSWLSCSAPKALPAPGCSSKVCSMPLPEAAHCPLPLPLPLLLLPLMALARPARAQCRVGKKLVTSSVRARLRPFASTVAAT